MPKGTTNRTTKASSRPHSKSDDTYNARRRYARSAERYMNKAEQTTGATAGRYRQLARQQLEKALSTYETGKQKVQGRIANVAARLGIEPTQRIRTEETRRELVQRSTSALESVDVLTRGEVEARAILTSPEIGKRTLGGLVDVWRERLPKIDGKLQMGNVYKVLFDYFNVSSYQELLQKIENIVGDSLYAMGDEEIYDTVKLQLQAHVLTTDVMQ